LNTPQSFTADDPQQINVGMEVMHARFGKGKVIAVEGQWPDTRALVYFPGHGNKKLLLKFARLKIL
jgi:DNA helicase-2/ATP-dependent DNA helicase PcrA